MIALHIRDSPMHLITSSQQISFGILISFGGSPFHGSVPALFNAATLDLRDLYRVRCYSLVDVVHNKDLRDNCQRFLWFYTKTT